MIYIYEKCKECGVALEIDKNDYMPGCKETEEVICPKCDKIATTVHTSGFPTARIISDEELKKINKLQN